MGKTHTFSYMVSNPPYQGENHQQVYPDMYLAGQQIADCVDMVFPTGWQQPKNANNLKKMNNPAIKEDKQIVLIDNEHDLFPNVPGAEWTNIILWKRGYDNGLDGEQKVLTNGKNPVSIKLLSDKSKIEKPAEIVKLGEIVTAHSGFRPLSAEISVLKPYGLRTDFLDSPAKYGLPLVSNVRVHQSDYAIYGLKDRRQTKCYCSADYPFPKKTKSVEKYKVLIGKAWGNFSQGYLGGAYADIIIAAPHETCAENFLESGAFDDYQHACYHAKYLMTQFCRALLFLNKYSQDNSKDKWVSVPVQNYSEAWWNKSITEIDDALMDKYDVPQNIRDFVKKNIQPRTEQNIVNYKR